MGESVYAAIDLELTGLKVGSAEIIEIGIVRCTPDEVLDTWSTLVRPYTMPDLRIQRITGITPAALAEAPRFDEVEAELRERLMDAAPIGHNVKFDLEHLGAAGVDTARTPLDTLPIARVLDPTAPSHRLGDLCERYGIAADTAHRALADAEASRLLLLALRRRWRQLDPSLRRQLAELTERTAPTSPLALFISTAPGESAAAPALSYRPPPIAPNRDLERRPVQMPGLRLVEMTAAGFDAAAADPADPLEARREQRAMALDIARAFDSGEVGLVEAGTGVGKSLAYLVPAALWSLKTGERVVISTGTRNLQHQLDEYDIPQMRGILERVAPGAGRALRTTVLKGRANYLCRRNLQHQQRRVRDPEDAHVVARALVWAQASETGDREELRLPRIHDSAWQQICAADAACLSNGEPFVENGACFLHNARDRALDANLIIVNHALLIANLEAGGAVLPDAKAAIVDEAHSLEEVVTEQLSAGVAESDLRALLSSIASSDSRETATLARRAALVLGGEAEPLAAAGAAAERAIDEAWSDFDDFSGKHMEHGEELWLTGGVRAQPGWVAVEQHWEAAKARVADLQLELSRLEQACRRRAEQLSGSRLDVVEMLADESQELSLALNELLQSGNQAISADLDKTVAWFNRSRHSGSLSLHSAPLNVGEYLAERFWPGPDRAVDSVVLTGATLTIDQSWDFIRRQLHVPEALESLYGSPFDYERRARIYVPSDLPAVTDHRFEEALPEVIMQLVRAAGGRTLALFTAHGMMRRTADRVRRRLEDSDIALEVQGRNGSPAQVVETLRRDPRTVVFGVNALWTGVDIPGDALSQLIICRLPFDRPDVLRRARGELYDDEFAELTVPLAVLRFRQGIGRLIRSCSDRGAVVVLDDRIVSKGYGRRFRAAMPPAPLENAPTDQIARSVKLFLDSDAADA